jgi:hypothetical protein
LPFAGTDLPNRGTQHIPCHVTGSWSEHGENGVHRRDLAYSGRRVGQRLTGQLSEFVLQYPQAVGGPPGPAGAVGGRGDGDGQHHRQGTSGHADDEPVGGRNLQDEPQRHTGGDGECEQKSQQHVNCRPAFWWVRGGLS